MMIVTSRICCCELLLGAQRHLDLADGEVGSSNRSVEGEFKLRHTVIMKYVDGTPSISLFNPLMILLCSSALECLCDFM